MYLANKTHKKLVVDIISESFDTNPSVNWVIKNDRKRHKRIRSLAEYAFNVALRRKGVYITNDNKGVAICYKYNECKESIADYIDQAKLALFAVGVTRIFKILKREAFIKANRPSDGEFLYFWFWGIASDGRGKSAARESRDFIFDLAHTLNLSIYLETSVPKNKNVYERFGFKTYSTWTDIDMNMWLMKYQL